ncbi:3-O-alpha-D-mannopyranosyl-alpha-D-mannopyranose xylosylphosphotransferase [Cyphellophora attinorum]|uniref:3-O-alpha-D-mannopyranosyl-alpha-D-mannopyranose xylosylphosphotransferase n=1 Tax=Cyphellophora attinorum TaxID=1664694 RepID=A0A0N1H9V4_9EURO|nr:3-O-alpha-D-mannopyranosyl-alpha-D-mannopyranose xylosylphosphotransferase [Phialophora attinorum]KPI39104.1 3-O-alpha-D-mannopyranosyl-alpha-D-mannopyranose xylosylphosphotransferase [Phialophora attinorum]
MSSRLSRRWLADLPRRPKPRRAVLTWMFLLAFVWAVFTYRNHPPQLRPRRGSIPPAYHEARSEKRPMLEPVVASSKAAQLNEAQDPVAFQPEKDLTTGASRGTAASLPTAKASAPTTNRTAASSVNHQRMHGSREKASAVHVSAGKAHTEIDSPDKATTQEDSSVQTDPETLPDFIFVPFEDVVHGVDLEGWEDRWISEAEYDAIEQGRLVEPRIDFVYLCKAIRGVNGSDDEFRATMLPFELESVLNDREGVWIASHGVNRYRDWDELRYSLRSVHENAGHFRNKLQIVVNTIGNASTATTRRRQTPSWLRDAEENGVQVIAQDDFVERQRAECLPTFNSLTIENQLFNLPSDIDQFFAMSDDMLLGARHAPSDVYSPLYGPVMGFKTNSYSAVNQPTEADAKRFGEKPFLIYTSWLLNRRFGVRKRKGQGHFGHSLSRSVMKEAITSFPKPEFESACKRFRGEPGFQLYSWYLSFHYLIERFREALIWSYVMLRSDVDDDGTLSWKERQRIVKEIKEGTKNIDKSSFRKRHYYHAAAFLEKAGLEPPQVNTNIQWTSWDGPVSMQNVDCSDFNIDDCLGPGFSYVKESAKNPLFSTTNVFDRAARQIPHCGDCLIRILLHQVRQGLSPLLPQADAQADKRELVVKILMRYKYTIMEPTNQLFVMVTDADQVDSTLTRKYVREGKQVPGQMCLNDDVSTTDEAELADTRQAMAELLEGLFPVKADWEK